MIDRVRACFEKRERDPIVRLVSRTHVLFSHERCSRCCGEFDSTRTRARDTPILSGSLCVSRSAVLSSFRCANTRRSTDYALMRRRREKRRASHAQSKESVLSCTCDAAAHSLKHSLLRLPLSLVSLLSSLPRNQSLECRASPLRNKSYLF